jgi:hypothetical protein
MTPPAAPTTTANEPKEKHNATLICLARRRCDVLYAMLGNPAHYQHPEPATPQTA